MTVIRFPTDRTAADKANLVAYQVAKLVRKMRIDLAEMHLTDIAYRAKRRRLRPAGFRRDKIQAET